ncbi:hypothetical protein FB451DRAFT_475250 [Mycena latifolia]|nr:hypothetical protein FB451DRAFT_475250 [Mycena latifolia]
MFSVPRASSTHGSLTGSKSSGHSSPSISRQPLLSRSWAFLLCCGTNPRTSGCTAADLAFTAFTAFLTVLAADAELAQLLALLSPDVTCERSSALLAGMPVLTAIRLHSVSMHYALRAPRRHRPGCYHSRECDGAPPAAEHLCGACACPRARGGCGLLDAHVVHGKREWI